MPPESLWTIDRIRGFLHKVVDGTAESLPPSEWREIDDQLQRAALEIGVMLSIARHEAALVAARELGEIARQVFRPDG